MASKDPQRVLIGRIGAYTVHSRYDGYVLTQAARKGFLQRFEREVDPEGVLEPAERARRAEAARKAYMLRLALKSAQARRSRRPAVRHASAPNLEREQASYGRS